MRSGSIRPERPVNMGSKKHREDQKKEHGQGCSGHSPVSPAIYHDDDGDQQMLPLPAALPLYTNKCLQRVRLTFVINLILLPMELSRGHKTTLAGTCLGESSLPVYKPCGCPPGSRQPRLSAVRPSRDGLEGDAATLLWSVRRPPT